MTSTDPNHCLFVPLFCLVALAGCSSSTPTGDGGVDGGGLTVDEYCQRQAEVYCSGWQACCELTEYDWCVEMMLDECESGEISSVRAGYAHLDGEIAEQCLAALEASFDDCTRDDELAAACRFRWYGDAAAGEPCRDVWHCQPGLGCVLDGTSGTCVELPAAGTSCGEVGVCQPGSYCSYEDWLCHEEPPLGQTCERTGICAAGTCVEGTCQATPWCNNL